jgi:hypothetical protein
MSDFLSHLLERSLRGAGTVRPQLFSVFEPRPANSEGPFCGPEGPALPARDQRNQDHADRISRLQSLWPTSPEEATEFVAATSKPAAISSGPAELHRVSPKVQSRLDSVGKQQSVAPSTDRRGSIDAAETNEGNADTIPTASTASPQVRPPGAERPRTTRATKTDEDDGLVLRPQLPSQHTPNPSGANKPVPRDPTKNRPRERRAEKIIEMITPEREAHRELIRARDFHAVFQRPPSLRSLIPPQQPKSSPVEPSINVTIGRIEVRATLPPASAQAQRPAAPILSLDEYLQQRAGGNRR